MGPAWEQAVYSGLQLDSGGDPSSLAPVPAVDSSGLDHVKR